MLSYSTVGVKDIAKAQEFYDPLLADLDAKVVMRRPDGGFIAYSNSDGAMFSIATPFDGGEASAGNGNMVAFACKDAAQVKQMCEKARSLGATCEGELGPRVGGMVTCGYVRDPDGNKLNFFCMGSE